MAAATAPPPALPDIPRQTESDRRMLRRGRIAREVHATCYFDPATGCSWCGATTQHVSLSGRPVSSAFFHGAEIEAEADRRAGKLA